MQNLNKSPLAPTSAKGSIAKNSQQDFTKAPSSPPSPRRVLPLIKIVLVHLGANEFIPKRLCTALINLLRLQGE